MYEILFHLPYNQLVLEIVEKILILRVSTFNAKKIRYIPLLFVHGGYQHQHVEKRIKKQNHGQQFVVRCGPFYELSHLQVQRVTKLDQMFEKVVKLLLFFHN